MQQTAHTHALEGKSFFLTGGAGTGKTYTLRSIIKLLRENKKRVAVTACTGIAAQQFGSEAKTLHSFAGYSFETNQFDPLNRNWNNFDVLIIDEISMLSSIEFKVIEKSAQVARGNDLPMGGMQVISCGDFYQLPPTYNTNPKPDRDGNIRKSTNVVEVNLEIMWSSMPFLPLVGILSFLLWLISLKFIGKNIWTLLISSIESDLIII